MSYELEPSLPRFSTSRRTPSDNVPSSAVQPGLSHHRRTQVLIRLKTATGLIITRGAYAKEVKIRLRLVFDEIDVVAGWTLPDLLRSPEPPVHRIPYPELIHLLRPVLCELGTRGTEREANCCDARSRNQGISCLTRRSDHL
ncbi:hypothetical protein B0H19DRAFT_200239 [Mycena capillaripes]|nr:hypothetical protein B0H19DRAFT_200239 [Mycena capillaripes]